MERRARWKRVLRAEVLDAEPEPSAGEVDPSSSFRGKRNAGNTTLKYPTARNQYDASPGRKDRDGAGGGVRYGLRFRAEYIILYTKLVPNPFELDAQKLT